MPASHADILRVHVRHAWEDWTRDEALLSLCVGGYSKILTFKPFVETPLSRNSLSRLEHYEW